MPRPYAFPRGAWERGRGDDTFATFIDDALVALFLVPTVSVGTHTDRAT